MDKISQAQMLLDSIIQYESRSDEIYSNIESDYSPTPEYLAEHGMCASQIMELVDEFVDDDFSRKFIHIGGSLSIYQAKIYLERYISSFKPDYWDDLLKNAENLRDEGLFNCSALCIRLYCEEVLNHLFKSYNFKKSNTLGQRYKMMESLCTKSEYKDYSDFIQRMNHIVHNDDTLKENPPTAGEISYLISEAKNFEKHLYRLQSLNDIKQVLKPNENS